MLLNELAFEEQEPESFTFESELEVVDAVSPIRHLCSALLSSAVLDMTCSDYFKRMEALKWFTSSKESWYPHGISYGDVLIVLDLSENRKVILNEKIEEAFDKHYRG